MMRHITVGTQQGGIVMKIQNQEGYDKFIDAIRLNLIVWREMGGKGFTELCEKLEISERTVRRRYRNPETLTLEELFAWCELYDKNPIDVLSQAFESSKK